MRWLLSWLVNAVSLVIVAFVIPGISFSSFVSVLIAALVLGIVNATIGAFLKFVTFPLVILSLGLFWFVINALMIMLVSKLVPGFYVSGFLAAFFGGILLAIVNTFLKWILPEPDRD